MTDSREKRSLWQQSLVAVMLALVFFLPSVRAYITAVPQVTYFLPVFFLVGLALLRISSRPWFELPLVQVVYVSLCAFLVSWLMLSSTWTISTAQYQTDLFLLGTLLLLVLVSSVVLDEWSIELFFRIMIGLGMFVGLVVVAEFVIIGSFDAAGTYLYGRYLTISHILGITATGASLRFLISGTRSKLWAFLALVLFLELALSLGRGSLLSALLIFAVSSLGILIYQLSRNSGYGNWVSGVGKFAATVLFGLGTLTMAMQVGRTKARLLRMLSGNELEEGGRGAMWREALGYIQDSPVLGFGLSSNGLLVSGTEVAHPHNLFLQVWLDGGILAVVILLAILVVPFYCFVRNLGKHSAVQDALLFPMVGMFFFIILEYSKSGNAYTARGLFLYGLCVIILAEKGKIKTGSDGLRQDMP